MTSRASVISSSGQAMPVSRVLKRMLQKCPDQGIFYRTTHNIKTTTCDKYKE